MNLKQILALSALLGTAQAQAMAPGTVINPLHRNGQFTVCAVAGKSPSGMPLVTQNSADLFKTKGLPVIISGIASNVPWWALTTGTGYLLVSQCDCNNPLFLSSMASGTAYAFGEQTASMHCATQAAALMSCLMVAYLSNNSCAQEIFFAAAQAIIFNVIMSASSQMGTKNKTDQKIESDQKPQTSDTTFAKIIGYGALHGSLDCLNNLMHCSIMNMIRICDTACLARILLYEQAYRLAQSGCDAAKQFFAAIPQKNSEPMPIENPD